MKNFRYYLSLSFALILTQFSLCFALPGIKNQIPDASGQYVYYKDTSFERESYIGIIFYDDSTYGLRYFAPQAGENQNFKPKKDLQILFTLDPGKSYVELTGERIITAVTPDDTDLINYIHDFIYEMTARRQKAAELTSSKTVEQDYPQFGGNVSVTYNPLIPIFNIEKITTSNNKKVFFIVTAGQLTSSYDTSFTDFSGFPELPKIANKKSDHFYKIDKKAKSDEVSYKQDEQSKTICINLDNQWKSQAENFFTLENFSVLALNTIKLQDASQKNLLERRLVLGSEQSYPIWEQLRIQETKNGTLYRQIFYNPVSKNFTFDFKQISGTDSISLFTMTVYADTYLQNQKYFEGILNSIEIK